MAFGGQRPDLGFLDNSMWAKFRVNRVQIRHKVGLINEVLDKSIENAVASRCRTGRYLLEVEQHTRSNECTV